MHPDDFQALWFSPVKTGAVTVGAIEALAFGILFGVLELIPNVSFKNPEFFRLSPCSQCGRPIAGALPFFAGRPRHVARNEKGRPKGRPFPILNSE
ncbi:hypothetical protein [Tropicibacter naphthalenivorans]|uniref:Uncharacterized protein n=1 Tax=Tropicibacter naphthalenivorans TaxID=441103 RepID=A0A0N7LZE0_9RHOB|nr:hypothetical protein [Tropicibacter naphthalenivorans]CUH77401.1 hypothetical protein TRN7648_01458 [Tropicibacter naphthalenivorans]SMC58265.1 hypothetical protein SAMN04488093_102159 [Tropicibacter naphthalenivorans]